MKAPSKFKRGARHGRVLCGLRAQPAIQKTHPSLKVFAASCMSIVGAVGRVSRRGAHYGVARSVAPSSSRLVGRSLGPSVAWSVGRSLARSVDRSLGRALGCSIARSIGRSVDRSLRLSVGRPVERKMRRVNFMCQIGRSFARSGGRAVSRLFSLWEKSCFSFHRVCFSVGACPYSL